MAAFCIIAVVSFVATVCIVLLFFIARSGIQNAGQQAKARRREQVLNQALADSQKGHTGNHRNDFTYMSNKLHEWSGGKGCAPGARPNRRFRRKRH